jgi:hypothetical protein
VFVSSFIFRNKELFFIFTTTHSSKVKRREYVEKSKVGRREAKAGRRSGEFMFQRICCVRGISNHLLEKTNEHRDVYVCIWREKIAVLSSFCCCFLREKLCTLGFLSPYFVLVFWFFVLLFFWLLSLCGWNLHCSPLCLSLNLSPTILLLFVSLRGF